MTLPFIVVVAPPIFGLIAFAIRNDRLRRLVVIAGAATQAALAVVLAATAARALPSRLVATLPNLDYWILGAELAMAAFIAVLAIVKRRAFPLLLAAAQAALSLAGGRWTGGIEAEAHFVVDQVSLLLVLIIGVVGGLIMVYAAGYMKTYHEEHPANPGPTKALQLYDALLPRRHVRPRPLERPSAHAPFLGSDHARFLHPYRLRRRRGAEKNSFLALNLNVLGGLAFSLGIILLAARTGKVELDALLALSNGPTRASSSRRSPYLAWRGSSRPRPCRSRPGFSAPWSRPRRSRPSSTRARWSRRAYSSSSASRRAMTGTTVGYLVSFIGILTFIAGAFAAVSRRNAKRVLALSTVSNLGLIATCAGIGTYELVWVALFLVLFHAIAKALLFISVGTASVGTGSLDIESMGGLIVGMPRITLFLVVGISCMFVAPFGMLVSKWAAMEAFMNLNSIVSPFMIAFLAFGSATTVLFWSKWMGLLLSIPDPSATRGLLEGKVTRYELFSEASLTILAIAACVSILSCPNTPSSLTCWIPSARPSGSTAATCSSRFSWSA